MVSIFNAPCGPLAGETRATDPVHLYKRNKLIDISKIQILMWPQDDFVKAYCRECTPFEINPRGENPLVYAKSWKLEMVLHCGKPGNSLFIW